MKESDIFRIAQYCVLKDGDLSVDSKRVILRKLMSCEDFALFAENTTTAKKEDAE